MSTKTKKYQPTDQELALWRDSERSARSAG